MITAAILASGTGSRMQSAIPKQYIDICGKPVFVYSAEAFLKNKNTDTLIVCVSCEYKKLAEEKINKFIRTEKPIYIVEGGKTRSETLLKILEFCKDNNLLDGIILTHDSVRPFVNDDIIDDSINKCRKFGAAIACTPATDTVFISDYDGNFIESVPQRRSVFHAQTPQTFNTKELYETIKSIPEDVFVSMTDAGSVYSYCGKPVSISKGSPDNIKITYPGDISTAENIIKRLKICHP